MHLHGALSAFSVCSLHALDSFMIIPKALEIGATPAFNYHSYSTTKEINIELILIPWLGLTTLLLALWIGL